MEGVDTVAGAVMSRGRKVPEAGDKVEFDNATAEVLKISHDHAEKIRIVISDDSES